MCMHVQAILSELLLTGAIQHPVPQAAVLKLQATVEQRTSSVKTNLQKEIKRVKNSAIFPLRPPV